MIMHMKKLNEARERHDFENVWISERKKIIQEWVAKYIIVSAT